MKELIFFSIWFVCSIIGWIIIFIGDIINNKSLKKTVKNCIISPPGAYPILVSFLSGPVWVLIALGLLIYYCLLEGLCKKIKRKNENLRNRILKWCDSDNKKE